MAYSSGTRLPFESASKLGHLKVIESEWVNSLIKDFETNDLMDMYEYNEELWHTFDDLTVSEQKEIMDSAMEELMNLKKQIKSQG